MIRKMAGLALVVATGACGSSASPPPSNGPVPASATEQAALADSVRRSFTPEDVAFMRGMIHHHAQALVMSDWAPTHDAGPELRLLTERIINAQRDEIELMRRWLVERGQDAPTDAELAAGHRDPSMMMPGMLSAQQMAALDAARGDEFDRLFLQYMIQHHQGALTMVRELFATPGAARQQTVFKLASDIEADQSSEIHRMQTMLRDILTGGGRSP